MHGYIISLKLSYPSEKGKSINFTEPERMAEIAEACEGFNLRYRPQNLYIRIHEIFPEEIKLEVLSEEPIEREKLSRRISYVSKRLYHDKNWKEYTNIPTKLFKVVFEKEKTFQSVYEVLEGSNYIMKRILTEIVSIKKDISIMQDEIAEFKKQFE